MGFFDRKKVRKTASEPVPVKPAPVNAAGHHHALLPAPPASRRISSSHSITIPRLHTTARNKRCNINTTSNNNNNTAPRNGLNNPNGPPTPQPIVVNQHYYLHPPPSSHLALAAPSTAAASQSGAGANTCPSGLDKFAGSVVTIAKDFASPHFLEEPNFHPHATQLINSTAACVDQIAGCFNDVMTLIDRDRLVGNEKALFSYQQDGSAPPGEGKRAADGGGGGGGRGAKSGKGASGAKKRTKEKDSSSKVQSTAVATSVVSGNYFAKVELYANSRLPMNLPPLKLYMATWPLLCMAAQYAERVYEHPKGAERDAHVSADWRTGTKAMVIKSVPMDHVSTIVFAIRGSATFMDWAVNLNSAPASPVGFLDDPGNSCHAGFLAVARKTVRPVAARLRQLLEEDPARGAYSLLITGHSAGGAVASLLYAHMLATSPQAESELNVLTGCFKRVHCVTFGTPPISLLPLRRPDRPELRKSLFLTFVNEGDPVARADKAYVKSLLELFAAPAPREREREKERKQSGQASSALVVAGSQEREKKAGVGSRLAVKASKMSLRPKGSKTSLAQAAKEPRDPSERDGGSGSGGRRKKPVWHLPPSTLSSPGRIVVLRSGNPKARIKDRKTVSERLDEGVVAQTVTDEELRGVVWGDPVCHVMRLYSGRIETLAVGAVTGKHG